MSFQSCDLVSMTPVLIPVFIRRNSAEFLIRKIPDAHLFLNSRVNPRQVVAFKVYAFEWSMIINSLLEKAFPMGPNIIHIIEGVSSVPCHLRTKEKLAHQSFSLIYIQYFSRPT